MPLLPKNLAHHRRAIIHLSIAVAVGLIIGIIVAPRPPTLGSRTTGDAAVAAAVRTAVGDMKGYRGLAVAVINGDTIRTAGLGDSGDPKRPEVDETTVFETGSVGKTMTGMLLADLAHAGVLSLHTPVRQLLPYAHFRDPDLASATLEELASHRAGLPGMPNTLEDSLRALQYKLLGSDPSRGLTHHDVITAAENVEADPKRPFLYSNLGMALAGHAAASTAELQYSDLLQRRILEPLGLTNTTFVPVDHELPEHSANGEKANGAPAQHWLQSGYSPAGDLWSTSGDMARYVHAVMADTAPGLEATQPRYEADQVGKVGLGWFISTINGQEIAWHDGRTGGFRSYIGFDRNRRQGVVVLSNTDSAVSFVGQRLLGLPAQPAPTSQYPSFLTLFTLLPGTLMLSSAVRRPTGRIDHTRLFLNAGFGFALLAAYWRLGAWQYSGTLVWTFGCALFAAGLGLAAHLWRQLPPTTASRPTRWLLAMFSCAIRAVVLAAIIFLA